MLNPNFFSILSRYDVYYVELEVHGILWYHTLAQMSSYYIHRMLPVIHNYGLELAFLGKTVDEHYLSPQNITRYKPIRKLFMESGIYVYPAIPIRICQRQLLFTMNGDGCLQAKPQTRAPLPDITRHTVFLPGTKLKTYTIVDKKKTQEFEQIRVIRIGAKRYGTLHVIPRKMKIEGIVSGVATHPYNIHDVGRTIKENTGYIILHHKAGDIGVLGQSDFLLQVRGYGKQENLAIPLIEQTLKEQESDF